MELQLHLPKKRLTSQSRCGLVLTLRLPAEEAFPFLRGLTPLTPSLFFQISLSTRRPG